MTSTDKPMFTRLNSLMEYSRGDAKTLNLVKAVHIFTCRHGGDYGVVLLNGVVTSEGLVEVLSNDWGWESLVKARPWFPYRSGKTIEEAMAAMEKFLNEELTHDREQLINWSCNCVLFEAALGRGGEGDYFDVKPNWKLTFEEAYGQDGAS